MMIKRRIAMSRRRGQQGGWSLIETMTAITIGLFVIGGLFSLLYNLVLASTAQNQLAGLEDNERVAMMALSNVIEDAGYIPWGGYSNGASLFPQGSGYANSAQFLFGTAGSSGIPSDQIQVRYATGYQGNGTADGVTNCIGKTNTSASGGYTFSHAFYVDTNGNLICTVNGSSYTIVSGLSTSTSTPGMTILYGVDTSLNGTATEYFPASAMSNYWWNGAKSYVRSVNVTLNFVNPLYGTNNDSSQGQQQYIKTSFTVFLLNSPT